MAWKVEIIADSMNRVGNRLTTFELRYPWFIHPEFLTHREFSRNSASTRAIPIEKLLEGVQNDAVVPVSWGVNERGMVASKLAEEHIAKSAQGWWLSAAGDAIYNVRQLQELGIHKQTANRLLMPFLWISTICSATNYANFFKLRCAADVQPEFRHLALMMFARYVESRPTIKGVGQWHTPYIRDNDDDNALTAEEQVKCSVARCARVSYLTHTGDYSVERDLKLHDDLRNSGHWSPFEHAACAAASDTLRSGNFVGWCQYRKGFTDEHTTNLPDEVREWRREGLALLQRLATG